ncbi:hypothetical protein MOU_15422 [Xanthomonas citri pv. malvacearum str. GSPB1386]|nr:hypothetical protein MOU_15422 [Xanthomonas citri pv. malvacearum str. GSPB1386]
MSIFPMSLVSLFAHSAATTHAVVAMPVRGHARRDVSA